MLISILPEMLNTFTPIDLETTYCISASEISVFYRNKLIAKEKVKLGENWHLAYDQEGLPVLHLSERISKSHATKIIKLLGIKQNNVFTKEDAFLKFIQKRPYYKTASYRDESGLLFGIAISDKKALIYMSNCIDTFQIKWYLVPIFEELTRKKLDTAIVQKILEIN